MDDEEIERHLRAIPFPGRLATLTRAVFVARGRALCIVREPCRRFSLKLMVAK